MELFKGFWFLVLKLFPSSLVISAKHMALVVYGTLMLFALQYHARAIHLLFLPVFYFLLCFFFTHTHASFYILHCTMF